MNQIHLIENNNGLFSENIQWAKKTFDCLIVFERTLMYMLAKAAFI